VKIFAVLVAAVALGFVLPGCGSSKESQQEAEQNLCTSLDDFAASVVAVQGLALGSSSEDDIKAATDRIKDSWNAVVEDAKDVKNVSTDQIKSQYEDLKNAIENRPKDKPISETLASLEPTILAFSDSFRQLLNGLDCKKKS
jgi:hypothetical protein